MDPQVDDPDTLDILTVLSSLNPDDAELMNRTFDSAWARAKSRFTEARDLQTNGDQTKALDLLVEAAILNSRQAKYWEALATAALRCGKLGLADAASRKAVHIEPRYTAAHATRAELLVVQRRLGPAMAHLLAAIEHGPATAFEATDAVERCYRRCVEVRPERNWDFAEIAELAASRGHRDKAIAAFIKGVARCRADPLERTLIALCSDAAPPGPAVPPRPLKLPLVLISQIQRSGGTLLAQLFDGHPQLLVHPHELQIGRPRKWDWPALDLSQSPRDWLLRIFEGIVTTFLVKGGYTKSDGNTFALKDRKPFNFSIELLCATFFQLAAGAKSQRHIINAYLTAFFAAWRERPPQADERWFVGFCPRLVLFEDSVTRFFADYPDGRLISCIRNPISWYASSVRHDSEYASLEKALPMWIESTQSALALAEGRPRQVHLLTYDELVADTKGVMTRLARALGIAFDPILLSPTYAAQPILPNSSFKINEYGVHRHSLDQAGLLTSAQKALIERKAMPLYRDALDRIASKRRRSRAVKPSYPVTF